jgi:hypothetical protein
MGGVCPQSCPTVGCVPFDSIQRDCVGISFGPRGWLRTHSYGVISNAVPAPYLPELPVTP